MCTRTRWTRCEKAALQRCRTNLEPPASPLKCASHVLCCCSSGASGGANKGPAVVDKRNQVLQCPHCDRDFKQVQRYREHIAKHHPDVPAAVPAESAADPAPGPSKVRMFNLVIVWLATLKAMSCLQLLIC